jgi:methylated-DNA-[protein]-cysteine S-methyltransferase
MYNSAMIHLREIDSPIGPLTIAASAGRICLLHFGSADDHVRRWLARWYPGQPIELHDDPGGGIGRLRAYFDGDLDALDSIEVQMRGTAFQQRVWEALRRVRAGQTASYSEIARAIGAPSSVRAVGAANGANPVAVIVPCHRIIGTNGSLTGYGGGLDRKRWLLSHEAGQVKLVNW